MQHWPPWRSLVVERDAEMGYSTFRIKHLEPYADAHRDWLQHEAEVIDTTDRTPFEVAKQIAHAVNG